MLVLERKTGEGIVIGDGPDKVYVSISKSNDGKVKLGIDAPRSVSVMRAELLDQAGAERKAAAKDRTPQE